MSFHDRRLPRAAALVAAALLAPSCRTAGPSAPAAPPTAARPAAVRPNVILVITDDMDVYDVENMPILHSEMVDAGTTFTNMFVTTPVCCPARASFLTGQYVHNHGVLDNRKPSGGFLKFFELGKEKSTIATWLQDAGYRTSLVGKYLNFYPARGRNPNYVPPGWAFWRGLVFPPIAGDGYYDFQIVDGVKTAAYGEEPKEPPDYVTDVLRDHALEFLKSTEADDARPFFLYLAPIAPHQPTQPAARHEKALASLPLRRPPSFNEEDVSDKPAWVQKLPLMTEEAVHKTEELHRQRARSLLAVDEMLGRVIEQLRAAGELDHTYILFTSDNGFELGQHRMDHGKGDGYEDSIRVPLIVRGPGVPAKRTVDAMVLNIDFAPTLAELTGASAAGFVDGRSFAPFLAGRIPGSWRTDFAIEHWTDEEDAGIPNYLGLRTTQYKYVEYPSGERELYDLKKDPYELRSLHAGADPALLQKLSARLKQLEACAAATCRP
jgi:N-acetylglucosamine-6-sulfatase